MAVLKQLEPTRVFHYFEEIAAIPHGSGNTKGLSDYLMKFAVEHELTCWQDSLNNIIILKPASAGYENKPAVILQGHMDMVCEKKSGSSHDFTKDGLKLKIEEDLVIAEDTTLGADDGIAVAYALAILEDDSILHPALEVVITVDEEIGLLGAAGLDTSKLKGKRLINLDSEEEGYLWCGCAGGMHSICSLPVRYDEESGVLCEIQLDGLLGGHSGTEIDKGRANAGVLLGRFLFELKEQIPYSLSEFASGRKDNAIPREARAMILIDSDSQANLTAFSQKWQDALQREYSGTEEGISITVTSNGASVQPVLSPSSHAKVLFYLMHMPHGVIKMSGVIPGLVETSVNPGILALDNENFHAVFGVRSSVSTAKEALGQKIQFLTEFLGGEYEADGVYPAWEYRKDSSLRDTMVKVYQNMFGEKPAVKVIHAGLECGIFYEKIPDLDCISFGPDIMNIHTTEEALSISSVSRMWDYLLAVLKEL